MNSSCRPKAERDLLGSLLAFYRNKTSTSTVPINSTPTGDLTAGGSTTLGNKTYTSITFSWPEATNISGTASYKVYASIVNTWTTLEEVEANGTLYQDFTDNITSITIPNLIAFQFYRFDVIVRDSRGTKVLYPHFCVQMDPNVTGTLTCKTELTGVVTTFAGSCGAAGSFATGAIIPTARYNGNAGMAFLNNKLYVADSTNFRIRVIDMTTFIDSSLAGSGGTGYTNGTGGSAVISNGVNLVTDGTDLYYIEIDNKGVRKIDPNTGTVASFVGQVAANPAPAYVDATGTASRFNLLFTGAYNFWDGALYIGDNNQRIRKSTVPGAVVSTVAGNGTGGQSDGPALTSQIGDPNGLIPYGNLLYIGSYSATTIRRLDLSTATLSSITAGLNTSSGKNFAIMGKFMYIADETAHVIRKMDLTNSSVVTLAGLVSSPGTTNGTGTAARFNGPAHMLFVGNSLYLADRGNNCIRKIE